MTLLLHPLVETEIYISKNDGKEYVLYKYPSGKRLFFISMENGIPIYHTGANSKDEAIQRLEEYISGQNGSTKESPDIQFINEDDEITPKNLTATASHIAKEMLYGKSELDLAPTILNRLKSGIKNLAQVPYYSLLVDLFEACAVLEVRCARKLAEREIPVPLEPLEQALAAMQEACRKKDTAAFAQTHVNFHHELIKAYSNSVVTEIHQAVLPLALQYATQAAQDPQRQLAFLVEHEAIYAAILKGNAAQAAQLMAMHLFQCMMDWETKVST